MNRHANGTPVQVAARLRCDRNNSFGVRSRPTPVETPLQTERSGIIEVLQDFRSGSCSRADTPSRGSTRAVLSMRPRAVAGNYGGHSSGGR